jgi:hypothetical protein
MGPAHGADSGSAQERFEATLGVFEIAEGICTSPAEGTTGFVFHLGDMDRGERAGARQARQVPGLPAVRLAAVPGLGRHQ